MDRWELVDQKVREKWTSDLIDRLLILNTQYGIKNHPKITRLISMFQWKILSVAF